jgi:chromosome partitioning protein
MASFRDMCFTPAEFLNIAQEQKGTFPVLESQGFVRTTKKRYGNVDRKVVTLDAMRAYFMTNRTGRHGDRTKAEEILPKHKIQMFYNVKGGTGKSTLTAQYVMKTSMLGLKVLAIDLDGQGHLTVNLDVLDAHERPTVYDVLINDLPLSDAVMNVAPGLDLIPANLGLCNIEIPLNNKARREYRLSEAIANIADQYDLIVADTNPAASILNGSMLVASQLVNVVCATNPLSFHGMSLVMATIEGMEREFKHSLEVRIIPNMYDNREVISQEVLGELRSQFPENCTRAVINRSADLNEATKRRTTVWGVNAKGVAAQDIKALTQELLFS